MAVTTRVGNDSNQNRMGMPSDTELMYFTELELRREFQVRTDIRYKE